MTYVVVREDAKGDVVDVEHYCSATCFTDATGEPAHGHEWPAPERADYTQHCPACGAVSVPALELEKGV